MNLKFINIGFLSISAHLLPYIDSTLIITQMDFMDFKITRISIRNDSHKKIFKNQLKFLRKINKDDSDGSWTVMGIYTVCSVGDGHLVKSGYPPGLMRLDGPRHQ